MMKNASKKEQKFSRTIKLCRKIFIAKKLCNQREKNEKLD